jgi:hypothetical protein
MGRALPPFALQTGHQVLFVASYSTYNMWQEPLDLIDNFVGYITANEAGSLATSG